MSTIPAGYKQTEVGVIPEDWGCIPLQELTDPARPIGYGIVQTGKPVPNGIRCVRVVDMIGRIDPEQLITTSQEISQAYKRTLLHEGDLVIALRGKIGAVAVIRRELAGANLTRGVALLSASDNIDSDYLSQYLSSSVGKSTIEKNLNGSALQEIPIASLRRIPTVVPPVAEQRAIAAALSDVDALQAKLDQLITKKRDLKQATMQQLLTGQTRLPGFSGAWEVKRFSEVLSRVNGKAHQVQSSDYQESGDYPVVDQGKERVIGFSDQADKVFHCPIEGVIIFGDHTCIVKFVDFDFVVGADGTQIMAAKNGQSARFHAYQLEYCGIATTGYNRHFKFVKEREFLVPPYVEQAAIASVLSDMDAELAALEARRDKTRTLKQGMMQELLTGRIRLVWSPNPTAGELTP